MSRNRSSSSGSDSSRGEPVTEPEEPADYPLPDEIPQGRGIHRTPIQQRQVLVTPEGAEATRRIQQEPRDPAEGFTPPRPPNLPRRNLFRDQPPIIVPADQGNEGRGIPQLVRVPGDVQGPQGP